MANVAARPPLEWLRARLRLVVVERAYMDDEQLLAMLSEGYQRACERSLCLLALGQLSGDPDVREWLLPGDLHRLVRAVDGSGVMERMNEARAAEDTDRGYYLRTDLSGGFASAGVIGMLQPPMGTVTVLYARTPPRFSSYADLPDPGFPPESYGMLAHYVRWRVYEMSRGAGGIGTAAWGRQQYEVGIAKLRAQAWGSDAVEPMSVWHPKELTG